MKMTSGQTSMPGKEEDEEEWIFTLRIPSSSAKDAAGGVYELSQSQPPPTLSTHASSSGSFMNTNNSNDSVSVDETAEQEALLVEGAATQQIIRPPSQHSSANRNTGCATDIPSGWTWQSPYWSLQSDVVLQATYRPYWQALPEFTNCRACRASAYCRTRCCRTCTGTRALEFYTTVWTTQDVVNVEVVEECIEVAGVGPCRALRVHLTPLDTACLPVIPDALQKAWEGHVHNMRQAHDSNLSNKNSSSHTASKSDTVAGPTIIFCLPTKQVDPPLLWKVEFGGASNMSQTPIALENLTVLDGQLQQFRNTVPSPTHIYIHGYQSWSFAGSIVKGQDQPQSAMPDFLSRAFNYGGSPPPVSDDDLTYVPPLSHNHIHRDNDGDAYTGPQSWKTHYQSDFFTCVTSDGTIPSFWTSRREKQFPFQALDETGGPGLVLGWLSQREQYGVIMADVDLRRYAMHVSGHGQIIWGRGSGSTTTNTIALETDWAYAQLIAPHSYDEEPMVHYLEAAAGYNQARPLRNGSLLTGWCSWYHFYENITASTLSENVSKLAALKNRVPTNVVVVDDGYMTAWGDWDSVKPGAFPQGMAAVARDIVAQGGMRAGLWLAPYAADKHSRLVKTHPDWIIRNDSGIPANSSNCGKFFYGLDATNPAVRTYVYECIRRAVHSWGFDVLKIDFLYAACLEGNGKHDLSLSRAQTMDLAMQAIRDAAGPNVFLIGCGCPVGSGIGYVDGMRVSADTGPTWYPALPLPWWDHGTLPCLRSMVRNSMSRAPLGHRWWHNDPDCLLLGESTRLTDEEVASAASVVAMTCGMMLLSDDLTKVSVARTNILTKIFPMTGVTAVVLDLHSASDGLPSLLRLWCTDKYDLLDSFRERMVVSAQDHNAEATYFARQSSSYHPDKDQQHPIERQRSCIHVTKGLGTWTVVSVSNWSDRTAVVNLPPPALLPPPMTGWEQGDEEPESFLQTPEEVDCEQHGCHAFGFWSSKYTWLPNQKYNDNGQGPERILRRKLVAHETEIYHIKAVTPDAAQYVGSDLHFSCGHEVLYFRAQKNQVSVTLKTKYHRVGHIFLFLPCINTNSVKVTVNGEAGRWHAVGNVPNGHDNGHAQLIGRVFRVAVVVHANGRPQDGQVKVEF